MIPWPTREAKIRKTESPMVYCVGLTGTIASGKSTAASYFQSRGITILSADVIARALTQKGAPALDEITQHFGASILTDTGELNRRKLRNRIIEDTKARQWLDACLHPRIRHAILESINQVTSAYCVIEIPLLTDRTHYPYLNRVLLIESNPEQQIQRLMARDACTEEDARHFLAAQPHGTMHQALADDVVSNISTPKALEQQLEILHQKYLKESLK